MGPLLGQASLGVLLRFAKNPQGRPAVHQSVQYMLADEAFAGVRGDALAKLPESERKDWRKLWEDVAALLKKTDGMK
jgi:hypothetical protein